MEETEKFIKIHDFLRTELQLSEVMIRVFSVIFTMGIQETGVYGSAYISEICGLSVREVKKVLKCLLGIGIVIKKGKKPNGAIIYGPAILKCQTTSEAKEQLMHAVHRCIAFTGAQHALPQCTQCTFSSAQRALKEYKKTKIVKKQSHYEKRAIHHQSVGISDRETFDGHDTL